MKTRAPFWPLLRNELLFDHFPRVPLALAVFYCLAVWYVIGCGLLLLLTRGCQGDIALFFSSIQDAFVPICCGWLFNALMLTGIITIPGFGRSETYEFYFTRAIARRGLFRAKTMVLFAVLLGPLILNMFLALRTPDLVLQPNRLAAPMSGPSMPDPELMEGYRRAFPGAHPKVVRPGLTAQEVHELVLPRATLVYAGWLLWGGVLGVLAIQAYCAWMARHVTRRFLPMVVFVGPPLLAISLLVVQFGGLSAFLERSFLFFAGHQAALVLAAAAAIPLVQWWAERRFSELEIS
ncbi:MAG: hypothetical protein ABSC18_00230 [Verrucomicrobiota bacterium]|jgi:hypothetical protein